MITAPLILLVTAGYLLLSERARRREIRRRLADLANLEKRLAHYGMMVDRVDLDLWRIPRRVHFSRPDGAFADVELR